MFLGDSLRSEIEWVDISIFLPPLEQLQMKHGLRHGEDAAKYGPTWWAWGQPAGSALARKPDHQQYHECGDQDCAQLHVWPSWMYIRSQWGLCRQTKVFVCNIRHITANMPWCDRTWMESTRCEPRWSNVVPVLAYHETYSDIPGDVYTQKQ